MSTASGNRRAAWLMPVAVQNTLEDLESETNVLRDAYMATR